MAVKKENKTTDKTNEKIHKCSIRHVTCCRPPKKISFRVLYIYHTWYNLPGIANVIVLYYDHIVELPCKKIFFLGGYYDNYHISIYHISYNSLLITNPLGG